jgi:hypothetical protein
LAEPREVVLVVFLDWLALRRRALELDAAFDMEDRRRLSVADDLVRWDFLRFRPFFAPFWDFFWDALGESFSVPRRDCVESETKCSNERLLGILTSYRLLLQPTHTDDRIEHFGNKFISLAISFPKQQQKYQPNFNRLFSIFRSIERAN